MKVCDRCGKAVEFKTFNGVKCYICGEEELKKDLCKDCLTDIASIIDLECEREEAKIYDVEYKEIK